MIVYYGGTSSGKSKAAEDKAVDIARVNGQRLIYLATMENQSEAAKARIAHHIALRQGKGFETVEEMYFPDKALLGVENATVLLECISNLVANVFYEYSKGEAVTEEQLAAIGDSIAESVINIENLPGSCLVVVTNNVFSNGKHEDIWCDQYMQLLGLVNQKLAARSKEFYEVTAEIPIKLKGD